MQIRMYQIHVVKAEFRPPHPFILNEFHSITESESEFHSHLFCIFIFGNYVCLSSLSKLFKNIKTFTMAINSGQTFHWPCQRVIDIIMGKSFIKQVVWNRTCSIQN